MNPAPAAAPKKKLSFWLMLGGGTVLSCCLLTAVCGALGGAGKSGGTASTRGSVSDDAEGSPTPGTSTGDDVAYRDRNGISFASMLQVVGPQVLTGAQLLGAWREDRRGLWLQLDGSGRYRLKYDSTTGGVAATVDERGRWSLDQGALTFSPESQHFSGIEVTRVNGVERDDAPGPPRNGHLDGVLLEYQPLHVEPAVTKRIDGLHLTQDTPPWWTGSFDVTLRRAPAIP